MSGGGAIVWHISCNIALNDFSLVSEPERQLSNAKIILTRNKVLINGYLNNFRSLFFFFFFLFLNLQNNDLKTKNLFEPSYKGSMNP